MSGIKEATVVMTRRDRDRMVSDLGRAQADARRADERQRASEAARKKAEQKSRELTQQLQQADQAVSRIQKETSQQLSEVRDQVDTIRREQNRRLEQISRENTEQLEQQSRDFKARLQRQADNFNNRLESQRNELVNMIEDVKNGLNGQMQDISQRMEQNRRTLERSINQVYDRVGQMEQVDQNHKELAQFWISEAESIFHEIEEHRHELFAPGKLADLYSALQDSKNDIGNQNYQTAIGAARTVFRNSLDLKEDVINAEIEWNSLYNLFSQLYTETENNLEDLGSMQFELQAYNEDGKEEMAVIDANIDYWTDGKLGKIREQFSHIQQQIQDIENCTSVQLQQMMTELAAIQEHMDHAEADSRIAIQLSQERRDIACDIAEALSDGFAFDIGSSIGTYVQNEQKDSYEGTIKNPVTHDQVSFRILPEENDEGLMTNKMELHYFSDTNQAVLDEQMLESITQVVTGNGTSLGKMQCREGYEHRCSDQKELLNIQPVAKGL